MPIKDIEFPEDAVQAQYLNPDNANQLRSMVAMNLAFSLFYTPVGIISWVYPAEIFPVEVRPLGNAITTFTNWVVNLLFAQSSQGALTKIGFRYFYVFFALNLVARLCYWFLYPETKGRTLEQMDVLFGNRLVPHAMIPLVLWLCTRKLRCQNMSRRSRFEFGQLAYWTTESRRSRRSSCRHLTCRHTSFTSLGLTSHVMVLVRQDPEITIFVNDQHVASVQTVQ